MPAVLVAAFNFIKMAPKFVGGMWSLFGIAVELFKWIRVMYDRSQRAEVAKAIKEAIKESRETLDNSKLINIINPDSEPFPRKKEDPPA